MSKEVRHEGNDISRIVVEGVIGIVGSVLSTWISSWPKTVDPEIRKRELDIKERELAVEEAKLKLKRKDKPEGAM